MTGVSIVMGVLNGEFKISNAIQSILAQEYQDWELIIVDDGSKDNSYNVIQAFSRQEDRIKILRNPHNLGHAYSLNKAIGAAKAPYIARMDDDDRCFPDRLKKQVEFLESHPAVDVLGTGAIFLDETGKTIGTFLRRESHEDISKWIFKENPFIHPSVMARRKFFEELGGYDDTVIRVEDYDLWLRGYQRFRYHNLQIPLMYYRLDTRPNWRYALHSSRTIRKAIKREGRSFFYSWYAMRPLMATFFQKIRVRSSLS